jgi:hypothetical protein
MYRDRLHSLLVTSAGQKYLVQTSHLENRQLLCHKKKDLFFIFNGIFVSSVVGTKDFLLSVSFLSSFLLTFKIS